MLAPAPLQMIAGTDRTTLTRYRLVHGRFPCCDSSKKRGPDQRVPVISSAITLTNHSFVLDVQSIV